MKTSVVLRWSLFALVAGMAVVGAFVMMAGSRPPPPQGAAVVGASQIAVRFVAPFVAAVSAYLLHPVSAYLDASPPVRPRSQAMLALAWPVLLGGLVAYLLACLWTAAEAGAPTALLDHRALAMMGVDALVITTWFVLGALAATVLPRLVAPLVGVVAYLWLAWLPALGTPWLRHVTGQQAGCCGPQSEPVPVLLMLGAVTAVELILAGGFALVLRDRRRRRFALIGPALVVVVSFLIAASLPQQGLFVMSRPRQDELVCAFGASTVCVWPEYSGSAAELRATIEEASGKLGDSGLGWRLPAVLTEQPGRGDALLGYNGQQAGQVVANAAFEALVAREPAVSACWAEEPQEFEPVVVARMLIAVHAGASMEDVSIDPPTRDETERLLGQSVDRQRAWIDEVLEDCRER